MKNKKIKIILLIFLAALAALALYYFQKNYAFLTFGEKKYYENGILTSVSPDFSKDVKKVIKTKNSQKLLNYPSGYSVKLPANMDYDFSLSPSFVRAYNTNLDIKMSREYSPYADSKVYLKDYVKKLIGRPVENPKEDMDAYFENYLNKFVLNAKYREANSITLIEDKWTKINGYRARTVSFSRKPAQGSAETQNEYQFVYIITNKREFYNFFFKTDSLKNQKTAIDNTLNSFTKIKIQGTNQYNIDLKPVLPKWNQETLDFYNKIKDSKDVTWGFFYPWALTNDKAYEKVASVEKKLGYKFPIILHYRYIDHEFPLQAMKTAYSRGETIELTMQVAALNNDSEARHNANFDVIDGKYDEKIRQFARKAKKFSHPFMFRLNNEMNTDWAQYSGVMLLSDPDIYTKVWKRIYKIFDEEGVNNVIWIFNPNDGTFPPTNWNSHISYYPGNEYVQMLGITGYNTGDYFKDVTGEHWKNFDEIYKHMADQYRPLYSKFPWIITEFASNSVGGDKEQWIREMFRDLPKYPEIKAAVWWSYYDPDYRPGKNNVPARKYWLDEKDEYLRAFKEGLQKK